MGLVQHILHLTNFRSPFLRTAVPSVAAAFAIQAAVALPSVPLQTERFYDASGSATFLAVTLLSLYLPSIRARAAATASLAGAGAGATPPSLPGLLSAGAGAFSWRQLALSAAVAAWSIRLGSYLFTRILGEGRDSRFDGIRGSPGKFAAAFLAQAAWVSLVLAPVVAVNSLHLAVPGPLSLPLRAADVLGGAMFLGGFATEILADRQKSAWVAARRAKEHDEEFMTTGLWGRSQYPNYFGECTLWTGIATVAFGVLASAPAQAALGFSGASGKLIALGLSYVSPAFTSFLLLKVSGVPLSEKKYDARYGDREDYREWKKNTPRFFPKLF